MSEGNVNRFVRVVEAFNRLSEAGEPNPEGLQDFLALLDPEIRFEPQQAALEGVFVGHEGVMRWLADLAEHYAGGRMEVPDIREVDGRVLGLGTLRVIGKGSGIEAEVPVAFVARFHGGLLTECKDYGEPKLALEAAGLG